MFFLGSRKTLMYFDGCASHLGCTIALRGGNMQELKKVKLIVKFLVYCAYHSRLETSLLMDEFALPNAPSAMSADDVLLADDKKEDNYRKEKDSRNEDIEESSQLPAKLLKQVSDSIEATEDIGVNIPSDGVSTPFVLPVSDNKSGSISPSLTRVTRESMEVVDFSDPLQKFQKDDTLSPKCQEKLLSPQITINEFVPDRNKMFKKHLDDTILSVSPLLRYSIPYLETEKGSKSALKFFITDNYYSELFCEFQGLDKTNKALHNEKLELNGKAEPNSLWIGMKAESVEKHAFTTAKICHPLKSDKTKVSRIYL